MTVLKYIFAKIYFISRGELKLNLKLFVVDLLHRLDQLSFRNGRVSNGYLTTAKLYALSFQTVPYPHEQGLRVGVAMKVQQYFYFPKQLSLILQNGLDVIMLTSDGVVGKVLFVVSFEKDESLLLLVLRR